MKELKHHFSGHLFYKKKKKTKFRHHHRGIEGNIGGGGGGGGGTIGWSDETRTQMADRMIAITVINNKESNIFIKNVFVDSASKK